MENKVEGLILKYDEMMRNTVVLEEQFAYLAIQNELKKANSPLVEELTRATGSMTDDEMKDYIVDNYSVSEVFDMDDIRQCVADEEDTMAMLDTMDRDEIIEWVKDNCEIDDLLDIDIRWQ